MVLSTRQQVLNCSLHVLRSVQPLRAKPELPRGIEHSVLTRSYNLPADYVLHTVGPKNRDEEVTDVTEAKLRSCYETCLELVNEHGLQTVAFCCVR